MRTQQRRLLLIVATLVLTVIAANTVAAHAALKSADPADKAVLASAPVQVILTFTEETSATKSDGSVVDASGAVVSTGFGVDLNERTKMTISLKPNLPGGVYTVRWKTVTEDDNGTAQGTFTFTVQVAAQAATAPAVTPAVATSAPTTAPTAVPATSTPGPTATTVSATATRPPATQPAATGTGGATSTPSAVTLPATGRTASGSPTPWRELLPSVAAGIALIVTGLVLFRRKARRV